MRKGQICSDCKTNKKMNNKHAYCPECFYGKYKKHKGVK